MIPLARMDWASSASFSWSKARRGWSGLGSMLALGMVCAASVCGAWVSAGTAMGVVRAGMRALMPLPSALRVSGLFMVEDLFGEFDVAFGAPRTGVVSEDRLAETGG